jgi:hypothetical protein
MRNDRGREMRRRGEEYRSEEEEYERNIGKE